MSLEKKKFNSLVKLQGYFFIKFFLGLFLIFFGLVLTIQSQDIKKTDSLNKVLPNVSGSVKFDVLRELFSLYNTFDYDRSYAVSLDAINVAKESKDSLLIIRSYRMNGYALMNLTKNEEAIKIFQDALAIAEDGKRNSKIKEQIKYILNSIALAYTDVGNYPKALDYHFKSLVIREEENNKLDESIALNNIGLVYYRMSAYQKAIEFYEKCLKIKQEINDKIDNDRLLINMALCLISLEEFPKAISYINDALDFCENGCSEEIKREALNSLGIAYLQTNELKKARDSFSQSLRISKTQNNIPYIALNLIYLSKVDQHDNNGISAESYLEEAEKIIESSGHVKVQLELYSAFSDFYKAKKDFVNSQIYSDKYILLYKKFFSETMLRNLSQAETNYAERENIKTIKEKNEVLVLKDKLLKKQRELSSVIVAVTLIVLTFAFVLIIFQRKYSKQLKEVNLKLEEKVLERTQDLKKTNEKLERAQGDLRNFLYKTSHDIRGPVATLKGLNNLGFDNINDHVFSKELLEKKSTQIEKMIRTLSRITVVADITNTILQAVEINFVKMMDEITEFENKNGLLKYIKISIEVEPNLKVVSDPILIRMILENMVDNSLKFFNESKRIEPYVKISVKSAGSDAIIVVKDNGVGIEVKPNQDVFTMFMRGSEKSETGGVGLYLCKICTDRLQGSIKLEKTSKAGTIFSIRISQDATDQVMELNEALLAQLRKEEPPIIEFDQETNN